MIKKDKNKNESIEAQEPEIAYQGGNSIGNFNFGVINKELTPTQIHLLRLYSINKSEEFEGELKDLLFDFYYKKLRKKEDAMWESGQMSHELLDRINNTDLHKQ